MSELDDAIEALKKTNLLLMQYRQSVLNYAFRGNLTEKWRKKNANGNVNPSEQKYRSELIDFNDSNSIPKGWLLTKIENLSIQIKGAIRMGPFGSQLKKHELVTNGIRVLWIEDVLTNLRNLNTKERKFITKEKYSKLQGFTVKPKDVLVTMMGTIGKSSVVPGHIGMAIISSHLLKISPQENLVDPDYLSLAISENENVIHQIENQSRGIIMKGLNTSIIRSTIIPLPPLAEQKEIINLLESYSSVIKYNEVSLQQSITQSKILRQSILKNAFEGKLVPQDPNDEAAELLLHRIKEAKSNSEIRSSLRNSRNRFDNKQMRLV